MQEIKDWYVSQFESFELGLNGEKQKPIHKFRKTAAARIPELSFPTTGDEEWKYTDISPVLNHKFRSGRFSATPVSLEQIDKFLFNHAEFNTLVFVNGNFDPALSNIIDSTDKLIVKSLKLAFSENQESVENYIGKNATNTDGIFPELNASFLQDGAFILIRKNAVLERPVHILYVTSANEEIAIQPRNLFILEDNAQASLIENYESVSDSVYLTNAVSEVHLGKNANLTHVRIQNENLKSYHISLSEAALGTNSVYTYYNIDFGSSIARNNFHARFVGEDAECNLNGLYLTSDGQLMDNHTLIDHALPNCRSNELYKGVLDGKSRGVFNGKVMVRRDAQKTNAFQANKNILLSDQAIVDTKPQLEIFADDVKCSHGATIGQLDEEALFYLRSRGLSLEQAKSTMIFAFAKNVVEKIKHQQVLDYLEENLHLKLGTSV